jgi:hypothetical protein
MRINDDHLYHGAALTQIAEHPQFTAINAFSEGGRTSRSSFRVNNNIVVVLKYAKKPTKPYGEYVFTFTRENLKEMKEIKQKVEKVFVVLLCVDDRQICCIARRELMEIIRERQWENDEDDSVYTILVTVPEGGRLHVYTNYPGRKGTKLGERKVPRSRFPGVIFEEACHA